MLARLHTHMTFANVVSFMALFVALSGGAYALTLPKNSVGAKQIKKNAVRASEIRKAAVGSSEVKDRSLLSKDFKAGQLPSGATGPAGPQGPTGPSTGPAGGVLAGSYPNPSFETAVNATVPIAVVLIGSNGSVASEAHRAPITGPPTATHTSGSGDYRFDFPGYDVGGNDFSVCSRRNTAGEIESEIGFGSDLLVGTYNSSGAAADEAFQCALYDL